MELGAFRNRNTVRKRYDRKETARSAQVVRLLGMNRRGCEARRDHADQHDYMNRRGRANWRGRTDSRAADSHGADSFDYEA